MPRKRPLPEPEPAVDWRAPLYFLHGEVFTDSSGEATTWQGSWVASEGGLPSLQEFGESEDTFSLTSPSFISVGAPLEFRCPIGRSGSFSGNYTQGDGRTFSDHEHRLVVLDHAETYSLVAERGESTIGGEYVSIGRLVFPKAGKSPAQLTLARRYIRTDDPRVKMTPWELVFDVSSQVSRGSCREKDDFAPQVLAPWKLLM